MQKITREFLAQIEAFVGSESTDIISYDDLYDPENWENIPEDRFGELVQELCDEGYLKRDGDDYTVYGSTDEKMKDYSRMTSGEWGE